MIILDETLDGFRIYLYETGKITSDMTVASYIGNARQFLEWLKEQDIEIHSLDRMVLMKYYDWLRQFGYKTNTFNTKVNSLSSFSNYLNDKKVIMKDLVFSKDQIKVAGGKEVDVYTDHEIELIQTYVECNHVSQRNQLIIKMLMGLGLRVSELINLKLEDIDVVGLEIEVHGKNNKRRRLPMKADLANSVRVYISQERKKNKNASSSYLLLSERSGKLHRNTVLGVVKEMGRSLNIEAYNHKFRHTLATRMVKNVPIQVIQKFLGHSEIQTTMEYYINIDKEELKKAIENI